MMFPPQANTANTATANFTDDSTPAAFVNFGTPPQFNPTAPSQPIASWMNSSVSVVNSAERDNNTGFGRFDDSSMRRPGQSQRQYSNEMPGNHWEAGRGGQLANGGGGGRDGNFNTGNNFGRGGGGGGGSSIFGRGFGSSSARGVSSRFGRGRANNFGRGGGFNNGSDNGGWGNVRGEEHQQHQFLPGRGNVDQFTEGNWDGSGGSRGWAGGGGINNLGQSSHQPQEETMTVRGQYDRSWTSGPGPANQNLEHRRLMGMQGFGSQEGNQMLQQLLNPRQI